MHKRLTVFFMFLLGGCGTVGSSLPANNTTANTASVSSVAMRHSTRRFATAAPTGVLPDSGMLSAPSDRPLSVKAARTLPSPMLGVTVDDISDASGIASSLAQLRNPVTRVVFDRQEPASYYTRAISKFDAVGYTMGELLDSSDMSSVSASGILKRTNQYLSTLGSSVDIWEIGNEVNGEWLGSNVPSKIHEMFSAVKAAGGQTAMTLYYEPPQTVTPGYDMIGWERKTANVPADMHSGLDYVLVSYYETDNNGIRPTQAQWNVIFAQLAADFPNAKIGFGEIGIDDPATSSTLRKASDIMQYYYGLKFPAIPRFVAGDFWWYFAEDCIPTGKPLLTELQGYN